MIKMEIHSIISRIQKELDTTFNEADNWFDLPENILQYKPQNGGWSIQQILEHIVLTSHFLLILIDKGTAKALKNIRGLDLAHELNNYKFEIEGLDEIGITKSFEWMRPQHMEPKGEKSMEQVRIELGVQRDRCTRNLKSLKNGEGVLYKITMSVNNLGKIDVYQYIYFLIKHAQRHLQQMEKVKTEFQKLKKG